jgi:hypothetical protein
LEFDGFSTNVPNNLGKFNRKNCHRKKLTEINHEKKYFEKENRNAIKASLKVIKSSAMKNHQMQ